MTGIYRITNLINNKVYIGQSINIENRFLRHRNELRRNKQNNSYLQNAWNKYGEKNFEFAILEVCTEEELDDKECAYIQLFNSMNRDNGYNLESGGHANKHMSDDSRAKMSKAKEGMYLGENNPMYGVHLKHTEEWKHWASKAFSG